MVWNRDILQLKICMVCNRDILQLKCSEYEEKIVILILLTLLKTPHNSLVNFLLFLGMWPKRSEVVCSNLEFCSEPIYAWFIILLICLQYLHTSLDVLVNHILYDSASLNTKGKDITVTQGASGNPAGQRSLVNCSCVKV